MSIQKTILGRFSWKRLVTSLVLIYVIMNVFVHFVSDGMMFPYNQTSYDKNLINLKFIKTNGGLNIATKYWKAENEKYLIIYFHGNYLDLGHLDESAKNFNDQGYSVLAMDYRGYGLSQGTATENNAYNDSQMLYDEALDLGYKEDQLLILGRSIGTGVATELALNNKSKALILVSPFTSAYRVMTNIALTPFDKFNNLSKMSDMQTPLFILHGSDDKIIKPWHSEKLYNQHRGAKKRHLITGVDHNNIWAHDLAKMMNEFELFVKSI